MRYKPRKDYIIPDILSRLVSLNIILNLQRDITNKGELEVLFTTILIEIKTEFRNKTVKDYNNNLQYRRLIKNINDNNILSKNTNLLLFVRGIILTNTNLYLQPRLVNDIVEEGSNKNLNINILS